MYKYALKHHIAPILPKDGDCLLRDRKMRLFSPTINFIKNVYCLIFQKPLFAFLLFIKYKKTHIKGDVFMTKFLCIVLIAFAVTVIFLYWQNNALQITHYSLSTTKVASEFTIVHLSDLHNKNWNGKLLSNVQDLNPDYIVITGDLVDYYNPQIEFAVDCIKPMCEIAPVFYVQGNHEHYSEWYPLLKEALIEAKVIVLEDDVVEINDINIVGLLDNSINIPQINEKYTILLAHRPEHFITYCDMGADLILAGHTHGGQIRIPFIGGFYAPTQGLGAKYISGKYQQDDTTMIISRGLGNSSVPVRIFNRPELVVIHINDP